MTDILPTEAMMRQRSLEHGYSVLMMAGIEVCLTEFAFHYTVARIKFYDWHRSQPELPAEEEIEQTLIDVIPASRWGPWTPRELGQHPGYEQLYVSPLN